jgi:hypothetical protein
MKKLADLIERMSVQNYELKLDKYKDIKIFLSSIFKPLSEM